MPMDKAENFTFSMDLNTFRIDDRTAFSVIRTLEIIGEAAQKKFLPVNDTVSQISLFANQVCWPVMKVQADEV